MTRNEIIAMAREAGGFEDRDDGVPYCMWLFTPQELERFATSVIAKEREECAKVCEERAENPALSNHRRCDADLLAREIRARGNP